MSDLLIDTHAMLWMVEGQRPLPEAALTRHRAPEGRRLFSVASLWEMAIKIQIGKLELESGSLQGFADIITGKGIEILPVLSADAIGVATLPSARHLDPFDRLIASQCLRLGLPLLSVDKAFDGYGVERVWAG